MMRLGDFPAVRIVEDWHERVPDTSAFKSAVVVSSGIPEAVLDLANDSSADYVVVIAPQVVPSDTAEHIIPEPFLIGLGLSLGFQSRSRVTGLAVEPGLHLISVERLKKDRAIPEPTLVCPKFSGTLVANETPQRAFRTAFALAEKTVLPAADQQAARNRIALSASLGSEALNGYWWILGALSAILGRETLEKSWASLSTLLTKPNEIPQRVGEVARLVRVQTGLPVRALGRQQSLVMKQLLPKWPPADIWQGFIDGCCDLGPGGIALSHQYRKAAEFMWPEDF